MKSILSWAACMWSCLACMNVDAQFNDSTHYYFNWASAGALNNTTTSNSFLLTNALRLSMKHPRFRLNVNTNYIYGEQDDNVTNNDYTVSSDGNFYHQNKRFFYWILANYTTSYSLKINHQVQTGAGVAYSFVDTTGAYLNLSDGILYEKGDLFRDTLHDLYHTYRNSFRVAFTWTIRNAFTLEGMSFFQNSLSDISDYIIKANVALSIRLRRWLNITTSCTYNKFKRTATENLFLNYGIRIEKYF